MAPNLDRIRDAFCRGEYDFTTTGYMKMVKRGVGREDIEEAIRRDSPEIIEDRPVDPENAADTPGPTCLVLGWANAARPLPVVVGYSPDSDVDGTVAVITVYEPDRNKWHTHRVRKRP